MKKLRPDSVAKFGVSAPDPAALVEEATNLPEPPDYIPAYMYGESIHIMRNKKMSWREIRELFSRHGLDYTLPHLSVSYEKWKALNPGKWSEEV
jgi:hypothetical protein